MREKSTKKNRRPLSERYSGAVLVIALSAGCSFSLPDFDACHHLIQAARAILREK
jgi:hypothetical protein